MNNNVISYCLLVFLTIIVTFNYANSQKSEDVKFSKTRWIDIEVGLIGDLKGSGMEFPSFSLGLGGNYRTRPILYTLRLKYN